MKLEETEAEEQKKMVLFIRNNKPLIQLVLAWELLPKTYLGSTPEAATWEEVDFSVTDWCWMAGLPDSFLNKKRCQSLLRMCIVFPSGKIHYWVDHYLQAVSLGLD